MTGVQTCALPISVQIIEILVMALGAGLAVWGVINLLEGYGQETVRHVPN